MNLVAVFLCNIFVDRVKDVNANMLQCEVTEYLVSFLRPQTPYTCVFLFRVLFSPGNDHRTVKEFILLMEAVVQRC